VQRFDRAIPVLIGETEENKTPESIERLDRWLSRVSNGIAINFHIIKQTAICTVYYNAPKTSTNINKKTGKLCLISVK
jgi:hypothetical protein